MNADNNNMKAYLVGGAVRDQLMGIAPKDRDFVVLGASRDELKRLGYEEVGNSYSIFLHPQTREQYTLAMNDNLQDDLRRRDLTINALAMDADGQVVDFYGGLQDLQSKTLRHVSEAFREDPLRIFRVARFHSIWEGFTVAPETLTLMKEVASHKSFQDIPGERIFQEMKLALQAPKPSVFFNLLREVSALERFMPELHRLINVPQSPRYHPEGDAYTHTMLVVDQAARISSHILVRFAALVHDLGKGVTPKEMLPRHIGHETAGIPLVKNFCQRLKIPNDWLEAALTVTKFHLRVHRLEEMRSRSIINMFYEMDAFRKPHLVTLLARAAEADEMGKLKEGTGQGRLLEHYFAEVHSTPSIPREGLEGKAIGDRVREERVRVLRAIRLK